MAFHNPFAPRAGARCRRPRSATRLSVEVLETRVMPYAASGNAWPHPGHLTLSFMPDGTNMGGPSSNLVASFNAAFGSAAAWQNVILKAAQTWAAVTNLNFTVVGDNGTASGGGAYQQGDPGMGDIRFGGFNFSNSGLLALGYMPPSVNNYSIAGDVGINTGQIFNINGNDYDLYTVMMHEMGHALGLDHSSSALAVMYSSYEGSDSGLTSDDIAGIQSIYGGPRKPDAFAASNVNNSFATGSNITSYINSSTLIAQLPNLNITSTSDVHYFGWVVPANSTGTMTVSVQSRGLSLLAPSMKIYNSAETQIASATGSGYLGSTLTSTVSVTPGQEYFVRVAGANSSVFGTGAYALTVNLGSNPTPAVPIPNTEVANGNPANGSGGVANRTDSNGVSVAPLLIGLDRTVYNLLGDNLLANLVNTAVSDVVELPFVDSLASVPRIDLAHGLIVATTLGGVPTLPVWPAAAAQIPAFNWAAPVPTATTAVAGPVVQQTFIMGPGPMSLIGIEEDQGSRPERAEPAALPEAVPAVVSTPPAEKVVEAGWRVEMKGEARQPSLAGQRGARLSPERRAEPESARAWPESLLLALALNGLASAPQADKRKARVQPWQSR